MSEAKFTPGPWSFVIVNDSPRQKDILIRAVDQEALGFSVVFVNTQDAARKAEAKANARLIAAAPDLLEALQGLLSVYQGMGNPRGPKEILAEAAIAKAVQS